MNIFMYVYKYVRVYILSTCINLHVIYLCMYVYTVTYVYITCIYINYVHTYVHFVGERGISEVLA